MTRAEKFKEIFGFEVDKSKCPFLRCGEGCGKGPNWSCTEIWWNAKYKTSDIQTEHEKWIKAIKNIKARIKGLKNMSNESDFSHCTTKGTAFAESLDIIDEYTKELMK